MYGTNRDLIETIISNVSTIITKKKIYISTIMGGSMCNVMRWNEKKYIK